MQFILNHIFNLLYMIINYEEVCKDIMKKMEMNELMVNK
jgi:hypothetical protein